MQSNEQTVHVSASGRRSFVRQRGDAVEVNVDGQVVYRSGSAGGGEPRRGVNLAGAEFGTDAPFSNDQPGTEGTDYFYNSERSIAYFAGLGVTLLRLPFRWERIQRRVGQDLDASELRRIEEFASSAARHTCHVVLDLHNYGRYWARLGGQRVECVMDEPHGNDVPVRREHFADLWRRLSLVFKDHATVEAYGLMNEPHDMQGGWPAASQLAVNAIRRNGDNKTILVSGDGWSHSCDWPVQNGDRPWIADPANNIVYEAHCYFDATHEGTYQRSFDDELKGSPDLWYRGCMRLLPFARWCQQNQVRGWIGEYGVPADDVRWLTVLDHFLDELDRCGFSSCYWAAGENWGNYNLSIQPPANDPSVIAPQLEHLLRRSTRVGSQNAEDPNRWTTKVSVFSRSR